MIFDTSYSDKETKRQIDNAVGKSYTFKERWKMGGIGSPRMSIAEISNEYKQYMKPDHYVTNANIELRPKGILVHFRHKLQAYTWVMPYSTLKIITTELLKIESEGKFITFKQGVNQKFVEKIEALRAQLK
ncbi:MAG: hypothetical protein AAF391_05410 [Bacteroidota bacterium]